MTDTTLPEKTDLADVLNKIENTFKLIAAQDQGCGGNLRPDEIYKAMQKLALDAVSGMSEIRQALSTALTRKGEGEKFTPEEWQRKTRITILDPDGWRGTMLKDFNEPIDFVEWDERMKHSTVSWNNTALTPRPAKVNSQPNRYESPEYCEALEQERDFLRKSLADMTDQALQCARQLNAAQTQDSGNEGGE